MAAKRSYYKEPSYYRQIVANKEIDFTGDYETIDDTRVVFMK